MTQCAAFVNVMFAFGLRDHRLPAKSPAFNRCLVAPKLFRRQTTRDVPSSTTQMSMWNLTSNPHLNIHAHNETITGVAWSPDGNQIATSCKDGTLKLWDVDTRAEIATMRPHPSAGIWAAWSPDGRRIATYGLAQPLLLWDPSAAQPIAVFAAPVGVL
eukprot:CAMPEP_0113698158 /NCGR_PEP_ID=MMETSP0038_2-20120614/22548_1 /TAXON_ID=2898 /ORGANISM="Cryptomonas paramecium" /LENGTH=157 /DNA_ID=CAMNT_0000621277 /DNA_START=39 /DNA_END=509 /DNA_ORIENTATION=- /assembly_acc=CAM_ASM_000170